MATKELRVDQIEDLTQFILPHHARHAHLSDPGTGKTPTVCVLIQYYWQEEKSRTLWAMPGFLMKKNLQELLDFTDFTEDDIAIYAGTPAQREKIRKKDYKVLLLNFDMFGAEWDKIKAEHPDFKSVAVDELHFGFKNNNSQRTQSLHACMRSCKNFVPMSGTLIDGRLDSAYPTIKIIEPRYYYDLNAFHMQHADMDDYGTPMLWKNHEKLGAILAKHSVRRTFEEVHGKELPIIQTLPVEMTAKQRWAYSEIEQKALLELDDRFIEAGTPAVESIRCRQIMQCPHLFDLMKENDLTGKEQAIMMMAEDHIRKKTRFVVFGVFKPEHERLVFLLTKLGLRVGLINSTKSDDQKEAVSEAFIKGDLDCIVGSPGTASVGYNWPFLGHIIYSSIDYRDTNFEQSYKRGIRGKREFPLLVTVLEYIDSIDQNIFWIVERKSNDRFKVDNSYAKIRIRSN